MIFNDNKKFAFVHIQKTGGISISSVLNNINGSVNNNRHDFIKNLINPDDYYKFAFVRNPFDRIVSWYNMGISKNKNAHIVGYDNDFWKYLLENSNSFSDFLKCTDDILEKDDNIPEPYYKSIRFNQLDYISDINGNVAVDFIGRFENIESDFNRVISKLSIECKSLPHLNSFAHKDYKSYYTSKDVDCVLSLYKKDIEYFNYKFE